MIKIKIGLIGFGKTGKAVANVILQNQEFSLEWVFLLESPIFLKKEVYLSF